MSPDSLRSHSLVRSRVPAQDVQEYPCVMERLAAIVPLHDTDHLRRRATGVLQPADAQAGLQAERDLRVCVGELLLHELERRERALELVPLERVLPGLRETRLERAHHAPRYPVARAVEAGERRAEADGAGHQGVLRRFDVVHEYRSCRGRAQRELVANSWRGEPLHALVIYTTPSETVERVGKTPTCLLEDEPAHLTVPLTPGPNYENITAAWKAKKVKLGRYQDAYATGALVIHVLLPRRIKPPSVSSAVVSIPAGSEP